MPAADIAKKLQDEDKSFVWIKRQVNADIAKKIAELNIKGIYQRKEYKRQYPEGEAAAHIVGFTNVEDNGQEGVELMFNKELLGRPGMRHVIKDRLGRAVEDVGEMVPPVPGRDLQLSIDSKVQFFAYQKLRDAVVTNKAKAGSVVVLDAITGEVLALANYPSYVPDKRHNLTGEQLRNRALTDTFEPGSVMKPFTVGLGAGIRSRQADYRDRYCSRLGHHHRRHHPRLASARRLDSGASHPGLQQRGHHQAGYADAGQ